MRPIIFDVDGVLIHGFHHKPEYRMRWDAHLEQDLGVKPSDFVEHFILGPFVNQVMVGQRDILDALSEVLPKLGFSSNPQELLDYWLEKDFCVNEELRQRADLLTRAGHPVFIATNQEHRRVEHLMECLGFKNFCQEMFYAAKIGAAKPDIAFFEYADIRIKKITTTQPLFFDDTPEVVAAANAFGWESILYNTLDDFLAHPYIQKTLA